MFRLFVVNIVQSWADWTQKVRLVMYNKTVWLVNFFTYIYCSEHMSFGVFNVMWWRESLKICTFLANFLPTKQGLGHFFQFSTSRIGNLHRGTVYHPHEAMFRLKSEVPVVFLQSVRVLHVDYSLLQKEEFDQLYKRWILLCVHR
jgi:hypothetical protein